MNKTILLLLSILSLSGCASVSCKPVTEGYQGELSTIIDTFSKVSATKAYIFQLSEIDGRSIFTSSQATASKNNGRGPYYLDVAVESRDVPSVESTLKIQGVTRVAAPILALGGGMHKVNGYVKLKLEPKKKYYVKGELSKPYSAVWIEDGDGNIVTKKVETRPFSAEELKAHRQSLKENLEKKRRKKEKKYPSISAP